MKRCPMSRIKTPLWRTVAWFAVALTASAFAFTTAHAGPIVRLWDTRTPLAPKFDPQERSDWKAVPSDLFALEVDPPKASSDPGYYGREYAFQGDAVIENRSVMAIFSSSKGRVLIYAKSPASGTDKEPGVKLIGELMALSGEGLVTGNARAELVRNFGDEVAVEFFFSADGATNVSATFSLDKSEVLEAKPG